MPSNLFIVAKHKKKRSISGAQMSRERPSFRRNVRANEIFEQSDEPLSLCYVRLCQRIFSSLTNIKKRSISGAQMSRERPSFRRNVRANEIFEQSAEPL